MLPLVVGQVRARPLPYRRLHKTFAELKAKGVEFVSGPKDQFYGVEAIFKDPFGNWFSLTQPKNY